MSDVPINAKVSPSLDSGLLAELAEPLGSYGRNATSAVARAMDEMRDHLAAGVDAVPLIPPMQPEARLVPRGRGDGSIRPLGSWEVGPDGTFRGRAEPEAVVKFGEAMRARRARVEEAIRRAERAIDEDAATVGKEAETTLRGGGARRREYDALVLQHLREMKPSDRFRFAHEQITKGQIGLSVLFDGAPSFLAGLEKSQIDELRSAALAAWAPGLHAAYGEAMPKLRQRFDAARRAYDDHYGQIMRDVTGPEAQARETLAALAKIRGERASA
jgi:hypothetical protein